MGPNAKTFVAAASLSFAFGSIHSFGAILEPLENLFTVERATVSFGYSLAIICLTLGVLSYGTVSNYFDRRRLAVICCGITAVALLAITVFPNFIVFLIAYGVVFGFCNGLAYALFLDTAVAAFPTRAGFATGVLTAAYGVGAATFSVILGNIAGQSPALGFSCMAIAIFLAGLVTSLWLVDLPRPLSSMGQAEDGARATWRAAVIFWLVYVFAASGGLMMLSHAAAIMTSSGADHRFAYVGVLLNALGNIAGSVTAGWLSDRFRPVSTIMLAIVIEIAALLGLMFSSQLTALLLFLTLCGYAYGSLIAAIPLALRAVSLQRYFGLVFTAWGVAGLVGPVLAGTLFDRVGNYSLSIGTATLLAGIALLAAWRAASLTSRS